MCDFCGRTASKGHEFGTDYPIHPCANGDLGEINHRQEWRIYGHIRQVFDVVVVI